MRSVRGERAFRLDPVRWSPPRTATLLRTGLVAVLLMLAAGLVYAQEPAPPCADGPDAGGVSRTAGSPASDTPSGPPVPGTPARPPSSGMPAGSPPSSSPVPRPPAGTVGVAVTLADPAVLDVLAAGDRVDLVVVNASGATTLAPDAVVLATTGGGDAGPGLYLAMPARQARTVVAGADGARLAVIVRP